MFKMIQPPVGTVIETHADAYLLLMNCTSFVYEADGKCFLDSYYEPISFNRFMEGLFIREKSFENPMPFFIKGILDGYTPTEHWRTGGELGGGTCPIEVYNATRKELLEAKAKLAKIKEELG